MNSRRHRDPLRRRTALLAALAALAAARPLPGMEAALLAQARAFGADCEPIPDIKAIGTAPRDPAAKEVHRLLGEKPDFEAHLTPLVSTDDVENYARLYLQEHVTAAEGGGRIDRIRVLDHYEKALKALGDTKPDLEAFYLLRVLSLLSKEPDDAPAVEQTFKALVPLLAPKDTLPHRLAHVAALERYLAIARIDRAEHRIYETELDRSLRKLAVPLVAAGAFDAARRAVAAARWGTSGKATAQFLAGWIDRREGLARDVVRLLSAWQKTQESARDWGLLLLGTFRRPEDACEPLLASGDSTLKQLVELLKMKGGLVAAAEVTREQLAPAHPEPINTGLLLLALELYERASPGSDHPEAKKLRQILNGKVDPLAALTLDPSSAHRGVTLTVMSDPPKAFVYVDAMLQAVPGSVVQTPCAVRGVSLEPHRVTIAGLNRRDVVLASVKPEHGLILFAQQKPGSSTILANAGKNRFLRKKIDVKGASGGEESLFDGEARPLNSKAGFPVADWPCLFTITLPQPVRLSGLRMKFWDADKRVYKYMIDISPDGKALERLVDRSQAGGSAWQNILFPTQPVRVIRIHGLHNSAGNSKFHVLELEGYEIPSPEHMLDPIVAWP